MSTIKNIRISLGNFFYKRKIAHIHRTVKAIDLKSAKSVAIIFEANDENNLKHVKDQLCTEKHFSTIGFELQRLGMFLDKFDCLYF